MKMYSFDDKAEQIELSHAAIRAAGHEVVEVLNVYIRRPIVRLAETGSGGGFIFIEIRRAVEKMAREGGGIITDLMFRNLDFDEDEREEETSVPPAGLLVVIECLAHGVPVVVCTDEDHHGKAVGWIFDGFVCQFKNWHVDDYLCEEGDSPPFGWVENKDWDKAVALLSAMREKMDRPPVVT